MAAAVALAVAVAVVAAAAAADLILNKGAGCPVKGCGAKPRSPFDFVRHLRSAHPWPTPIQHGKFCVGDNVKFQLYEGLMDRCRLEGLTEEDNDGDGKRGFTSERFCAVKLSSLCLRVGCAVGCRAHLGGWRHRGLQVGRRA